MYISLFLEQKSSYLERLYFPLALAILIHNCFHINYFCTTLLLPSIPILFKCAL